MVGSLSTRLISVNPYFRSSEIILAFGTKAQDSLMQFTVELVKRARMSVVAIWHVVSD